MKNFEFVSPTKIYFGPGKENDVGSILKDFGASRVLIVIGKNSVIKRCLQRKRRRFEV